MANANNLKCIFLSSFRRSGERINSCMMIITHLEYELKCLSMSTIASYMHVRCINLGKTTLITCSHINNYYYLQRCKLLIAPSSPCLINQNSWANWLIALTLDGTFARIWFKSITTAHDECIYIFVIRMVISFRMAKMGINDSIGLEKFARNFVNQLKVGP